jgi:hypothetical protein
MKSTSKRRLVLAAIAIAFSSTLSLASSQAWSQSLIGDGLAASDDPSSPYYRSQATPPSWQGRPYAIPGSGWQDRRY